MNFYNLHQIADNHSKVWREHKTYFKEPNSVELWDEKGRELINNPRLRDDLKRSMRACLTDVEKEEDKIQNEEQRQLEEPVLQYMGDQLEMIAMRLQAMTINIEKILEVELENENDVFKKMSSFQLYSDRLMSDVDELTKLEDMFYRGDCFGEHTERISLSFALVKALKEFLKNNCSSLDYFLEGVIPVLLQFLGFMRTEFPKAMRLALNASFTESSTPAKSLDSMTKKTAAPQAETGAKTSQQSSA